jgi:maltooligosyltrehalose trehalohydrolase
MTDFALWAPEHEQVRVHSGQNTYELSASGNGWWRASLPHLGPGTDYAYLLDDDPEPLPDPRSVWQPAGVHSASRVYDHDAFGWTDSEWTGRALPGGIVYELHIGTFTPQGTFDAAIDRLDHLVELGIDFVEVLPVNAFDGTDGWGYDGVLWYAVHEPYGGPDGFKRFVDACHARGLAVLLDVVYNHLGPSGAYLDRFGPYFAGQTIWGPTLNLDGPCSDEVRRYAIDNAVGWLRDFHVDGLRLDAVHALSDRRAIHLLEELSADVDSLAAHLHRPLSLIAESDLNDPKLITPREAGGFGLQAQWSDDLHHCLHSTLTGERQGYYCDFGSLPTLASTLRGAFFHAGTWSSFRKRTHGRPVDTLTTPGHRFLVYLQNHDQIGNRATGDRLSATVSPGLLVCGAALVLCSPYTPMMFMGEEWAASTPWRFFASFPDPRLAEAVRTGRRSEFADHGWAAEDVPDPMDPATVENSRLRWSELDEPDHAAMFAVYRQLIALRRAHPELSDPRLDRLQVDISETPPWIVLHRGVLRVACNLGSEAVRLQLSGEVLFASAAASTEGGELALPPESVAILRP